MPNQSREAARAADTRTHAPRRGFYPGSPIADVRSKKTADWQVRTPIFGRKTEGPRHLASHDQEEPLSRPERMECSLTPTDRVGFRQFRSFSLELQPKQRHFGVYIAHYCTLAIVFTS